MHISPAKKRRTIKRERRFTTALLKAGEKVIAEYETTPHLRPTIAEQIEKLKLLTLRHALRKPSQQLLVKYHLPPGIIPEEVLANTIRNIHAEQKLLREAHNQNGHKEIPKIAGVIFNYSQQLNKYLRSVGLNPRDAAKYEQKIQYLIQSTEHAIDNRTSHPKNIDMLQQKGINTPRLKLNPNHHTPTLAELKKPLLLKQSTFRKAYLKGLNRRTQKPSTTTKETEKYNRRINRTIMTYALDKFGITEKSKRNAAQHEWQKLLNKIKENGSQSYEADTKEFFETLNKTGFLERDARRLLDYAIRSWKHNQSQEKKMTAAELRRILERN